MSGDVQPRKRKDKKRKKDELSIDEPRGTAAALGEGDVFMHSYHDHGTGGHWCAKIIFFSLLAVLITLIGLIILENRGLSELEANTVESRYAGMLEGWLEDAPDDDHHDEHTLELKDHDDDEDEHYDGHDENDHDDLANKDDDEEDETNNEESREQDLEEDDEEEDVRSPYKYYARDNNENDEDDDGEEDTNDEEEENDDEETNDNDGEENDDESNDDDDDESNYDDEETENDNDGDNDSDQRLEQNDDDDNDNEALSNELDNDDDNDDENDDDEQANDKEENEDEEENKEDEEEEHEEDHEEADEIEVEHIEQEASEEEEPISSDLPALPEEDDDDDKDDKDDDDDKDSNEADDAADGDDQEDDADGDNDDDDDDDKDDADDDFLEADDDEPIERIVAPAGKPFVEVEEDETSNEKPPDTLEEEEEYEKQQEELRREEEQSSHMWLKLAVGGALLAATHAVVRRATGPRDEPVEERVTREETPVIDRRMTLIPEEAPEPVLPKKVSQESSKLIVEEIVRREVPVVKAAPVIKQESEEEVEEPEEEEEAEEVEEAEKEEDKELYSDEDFEEEEVEKKVETPKHAPEPEPEADDEVPDDVEIIDDEQLEEELEEEEEDISDVDDTDLLSRLEAKYGRLPEPERPGQKPKDGGNSADDEWPGEPAEEFWRQQLDSAEQQLRQGEWLSAAERAGNAALRGSARARYLRATALDRAAEAQRDNRLLSQAITAYIELLKMNDNLSDKKLLQVTNRALDRIQFRGTYLNAEPVYRLLIRRFPNEPAYRNNLTISYLMANRADLAEEVLKETLKQWPNDKVALAHYGFVLKTLRNKLEEAVEAFQKALDGDKGPACEPRFYYHYGDALLLLGRYEEAHEVHKRGAKHGHFLSPAQRSLYNVPRLKSQPWWNVAETPYVDLARALEKSWREILKEGEAAKSLYEKEKEGLKERGEWSQMDLFVRGAELPGRCKRAPVSCSVARAAACRRGQVKFSGMAPGTHVRPHVGPTNCRLRMHLGLKNTKDTYIRVDQETRQWQEGKVLLFDDSFEHEVWHNGTGERLVLIVDVWHPGLTPAERRALPAI